MLNFLGYIVFSGFEYCGILLLMLSVFNFNIKYYKKEFAITIIFITILSYIITLIAPSLVIVFITFSIILSLKLLFKIKLVKSIIITFGGSVIYVAMQAGVFQYAVHSNYLKVEDLDSAFTLKSYVMQTLTATIAITISIYFKVFNGGFGFTLRSKNKSYGHFLIVTIISFLLSVLCVVAFKETTNYSFFNLLTVVFIASSGIISFFSFRRDKIEYS